MHLSRPTGSIVVALLALTAPAWGQDLVRQSAPERWIEQYLPEKLPDLEHPSYFDDLEKARAMIFTGRYKSALVALQNIKGDPVDIALLKAEAMAAVGRREEAVQLLSPADLSAEPRVQVLTARILSDLGRLEEAISLLKAHLEKNPQSLPGRWHLGAISEQAGDVMGARQAYEWVHQTWWERWQGLGPRNFEDAEQVTLMGRAFDRHFTLTGAYANNAPLAHQIIKLFVQAYDIIDRSYWPARIAAAEYFMSHGNSGEAAKELQAALEVNPNAERAYLLLGLIALERWNFDGADRAIAKIREIDAASITADLLECRALLQQRVPSRALRPVQRVLARQPENLEALGLLAAAHALRLEEEKVREVLAKVEKLDPDNASAYLELGNALGAMRQYPRAEKMYEIAIDRAPWWTDPRNGLGLLLTQSGDEDKAKIVLDAAYALDPFNHRTTNYLILLDKMAGLDRKESEHFVVIYDGRQDPLLVDYFLEYLESIHDEICAAFGHEPTVKTLIEVFPTHEQFSVRTTGSPWIGTVGASTGRVIALVAPRRGRQTLGTYNWAQVLRHEYTHTVTLSATDNRIGHWMTEGLAVYQERIPIRWEWVPMLYNAVKTKQIFSLEDLTWAFVRPKRPQDRSLAYAQSYWICKYIEEKWGHDTILRMMEEFKNGKTQDEVFPSVLSVGTRDFDEEFFAWCEEQVAGWGYDEETSKRYKVLVEDAEQLVKAREYEQALEAWQAIVQLRPVDQLPHIRLAGLYLSPAINNPQKAREHLIRLHQVSLKDNRYAKRIARLCLDIGDLENAEKYALESVFVDPYDLAAHQLLADVYEKTGNQPGLERERRVIPLVARWLEEYRTGEPAPAR